MMLLRKMNLTKRFRDPTIAITIEFTPFPIKDSLDGTKYWIKQRKKTFLRE